MALKRKGVSMPFKKKSRERALREPESIFKKFANSAERG